MINENNEIICNCNNVIEIMNNMDAVTAPLSDDNYDNKEIDNRCKIFFNDDFQEYMDIQKIKKNIKIY